MWSYRRILSGIYCLVFQSGHFYYGQSEDIARRFYHHGYYLRRGTHGNRFMRAVFRKYGPPALRVECLADKDALTEIEQAYIDATFDNPYSLNLERVVKKPTFGRVWTEHERRRISEKVKEHWAAGRYEHVDYSINGQRMYDPEHVAALAQVNRSLWQTEDYREKQRLARAPWLESEACRQHLAENRARATTPEANKKRSASLRTYYADHPELQHSEKKKEVMRKNCMKRAKRVSVDGVVYESIVAAEKALGYKRWSGAVERIIRLFPERAFYVGQCQDAVDPPAENL